jgi:Sec-independent protein translocase protein TatA
MNIFKKIWQKIEFSIKVYKYNLALKKMITLMKEFQKATKEYEKAQQEFLNYLHQRNFQVEIVNNEQQNEQKPEERNKISYIG